MAKGRVASSTSWRAAGRPNNVIFLRDYIRANRSSIKRRANSNGLGSGQIMARLKALEAERIEWHAQQDHSPSA